MSHRLRSLRLMKRMASRKKNVLHKHKILLIHNDVWKRWSELRKHLNLDSNSSLAELLLDTWYRAEAYDHLNVDNKDNLSAVNLYSHCEGIAASLEIPEHVDHSEDVIVKTEILAITEPSGLELIKHNTDEIDELEQFANKKIEMIVICEDKTNSEKGKERISKRVRARGFRPNYASMEWNECVEHDTDAEEDSSGQHIKVEIEQPDYYESEETYQENTENRTVASVVKSDCDTKLILKRSKKGRNSSDSSDPDFEINEGEVKDFVSDKELSGSDCNEIDSKVKHKKKRGKKRKSENDDEPGITKIKKLNEKKDKKEKRNKGEKVETKPKPWVHIKLEDHSEKFRMESVGSFERKNRNSNIVEELYTCLQCGRFKSTAKEIFEEHIEKHVNQVLECSQCSYVGRSEIEVMRHKMSHGHMHKGQEYMCDICGVVLYSWDSRLSHMGKVHNDPRFKCRFCGEKYVTRLKRQQHTRTVHADVSQYCNICKADFQTSTTEQFKEHQAKCKPGHPCQVCGVVLASKNGLNNHLKATHMGVRKYQCHMCQYAGKSAQRLREHIMTHTSDHPYSCDKCTFTCVQACQLKSHQRTHTGDKPYKCTQCNFAAAWNVQLKDHLKVHYMDSAVVCQPCNILFKNDKARKMHEKKDHYCT